MARKKVLKKRLTKGEGKMKCTPPPPPSSLNREGLIFSILAINLCILIDSTKPRKDLHGFIKAAWFVCH